MFDRIEQGLWWDHAWSLVEGCTVTSTQCLNCWACRITQMRSVNPRTHERYVGLTRQTENGPEWTGQIRPQWADLGKPAGRKKPTVFSVWNDLFHSDVPDGFIDCAQRVMHAARQHLYLVCTKRHERMMQYFRRWGLPRSCIPMVSAHAGNVGEVCAALKQITMATVGLSIEPLLGSITLPKEIKGSRWWIIAGCESGPRRRRTDVEVFRNLRNQCADRGCLFFLKQMEVNGIVIPAPVLDGRQWLDVPEVKAQ